MWINGGSTEQFVFDMKLTVNFTLWHKINTFVSKNHATSSTALCLANTGKLSKFLIKYAFNLVFPELTLFCSICLLLLLFFPQTLLKSLCTTNSKLFSLVYCNENHTYSEFNKTPIINSTFNFALQTLQIKIKLWKWTVEMPKREKKEKMTVVNSEEEKTRSINWFEYPCHWRAANINEIN